MNLQSTPSIALHPQTHPTYLTLVIPAFNEADRIESCLEVVTTWIEEMDCEIEVLIVDDGSTDGTASVAERYSERNRHVRVLPVPHRGKASAVLAGLVSATGQYAGFCDVDLATPLSTWNDCAHEFDGGAAIAIASREGKGAARIGEPWYRHAMGRAFNGLIRLLLLPGIHDTQCGFKFFTREALDVILPRCRLYEGAAEVSRPRVTAFDVELLYIARRHRMRIGIVPVTWSYGDHTKVNPITDTLQNVTDVLKVRWFGWRGHYD